MKTILLLIALLVSTITYSQWNILGNTILGEHEDDNIGASVSINGDGTRAAVYDTFVDGDSRGRVRVFELQNDSWVQIGNGVFGLMGDGTSFGNVMLNEDGTRYVFSSHLHDFNGEYSGAVRVFELQNNNWNQMGSTIYGEDTGYLFGEGVAINAVGDRIICGSSQDSALSDLPGFANVYAFENGNWVLMGDSIVGEINRDQAGKSVSINSIGNIVAVASPGNDENGDSSGKVRVFEFQNNSWNEIGGAILGENQGDNLGDTYAFGSESIQLNGNGNRIVVGAMNYISGDERGQVRIFEIQDNDWIQLGNDITGDLENLFFGSTVSFNETGNIVAIGDPYSKYIGEIKVFKLESGEWTQKGETISGNGEVNSVFGCCTDLNKAGDIIITSEFLNDTDEQDRGKVTVYKNNTILSINKSELEANISLYPNPNNGNFSIKLSETFESVSVHISDILGKQISDLQFLNTNEATLNENLCAGIYFVKVRTASSASNFKMIVE